MSSNVPAVRITNLVKVFKPSIFARDVVRAVDDISFEIAPGEVYGLIGPNGSGKSTTMKVLLGLLNATSGKAEIFGRDSGKVDSREDVGFLPENPYFYKHLSGEETLNFYGRLCSIPKSDLKSRVDELLELVGLQHARTRRLGGYSKGMLQRIGLAQALIQNPRLVVLDEPTAGVDPSGSRKIRDLVFELKNRGISVILTSHLLEQVQEVCDHVGIMYNGKMVEEGNLAELISIEDQTEFVMKNASPELKEKISALVAEDGAAELLSVGHPKTTLERLFLKETGGEVPDEPEYRN